jgi:hypothetical protein
MGMEQFFIGLHHPSTAWPFLNVMISVNALSERKSGFRVNNWIMDSGAFSQISRHGKFVMSPDEYIELIAKFSVCGTLRAAVCQDWMCEPFILEKTGLDIREHQWRTIQSYMELSDSCDVPILPVLQGFTPSDYVKHVKLYAERLKEGAWVGVGSVCKRNSNPDAIEDILLEIKRARPDLRLHGFGLKIQALKRATIRALLHSSDSMAWSDNGRKNSGKGNDPRLALRYAAQVERIIEHPVFIQEQLSQWWA